jgi:hypothetical protein
MTCNNTNFYQLLTIDMYLNDLIFQFNNILIHESRVFLIVMYSKTMFVTLSGIP